MRTEYKTAVERYNKATEHIKNVQKVLLQQYNRDLISFNDTFSSFDEVYHRYSSTNSDLKYIYSHLSNDTNYEFNIYIHYPKVTVTNEVNESTILHNVYVALEFSYYGKFIGFTLLTASPTKAQQQNGYQHSHVPTLNKTSIPYFANCCLGNGPIRNTIEELKKQYNKCIEWDKDKEITWLLFLQELDLYVQTESLAGGPYISLKNIKNTSTGHYTDRLNCNRRNWLYELTNITANVREKASKVLLEFLYKFIDYYLKNFDLSITRLKSGYCIHNSGNDVMIDINEKFYTFINLPENQQLKENLSKEDSKILYTIFRLGYFDNATHKFTMVEISTFDSESFGDIQDTPLFLFNKKMVCFNIIEEINGNADKYYYFISSEMCKVIADILMFYFNYFNTNGNIEKNVIFL